MTAQSSEHTTHRTGTVALVLVGLLAVAALMAAMVWVVQGQVQQAEVLRAQWQSPARTPTAAPADMARGAAAPVARTGGGLMSASFDRP
ncbi:MAG: hypothetical protein ACKVOT_17285 [Polaromonas sp.]